MASPARAERRKRIAVYGGAFDPITDGHLKCACEIIHARAADEVWIVPCGTRPDKPSLRTPYLHRLIMCHLAVDTSFGSTFPIRVCDIEMGEPAALSTYHLMERLTAEYATHDFMFVIGADLLADLKGWDAPGVPDAGQRLYESCLFLVLARPNYSLPDALPGNFTPLRVRSAACPPARTRHRARSVAPRARRRRAAQPLEGISLVTEDVSSTEIRKRITMNFGELEREELSQGHFQMVRDRAEIAPRWAVARAGARARRWTGC